jgi:DNA polymerase-3 subunit delta'
VASEALVALAAGQPRGVELLQRALAQDRIAHAYALVGPPGSGRTSLALAFGQALLCPRGGCGACRMCHLASARQHPDLHLIVPTPPDTNPKGARALRIGAIRELERQAALAPLMAARKVFVLDDADRMTGEAPQAFLKTLEEPPPRTVLVLVLARARAVPATVLSRCHIVRLQPPAPVVDGERSEALEILEEARAKGAEALFRRTQAFDRDRERAERFVDACWLLCRDLVLARVGAPATLLADPAAAPSLAEEAQRWRLEDLLAATGACREAREALAVNVTPRLTLEVILTRLARRAA